MANMLYESFLISIVLPGFGGKGGGGGGNRVVRCSTYIVSWKIFLELNGCHGSQ